MTATIRPSLILNMDVDERQFSDDVVAEIKRSYSYVAPSVVAVVMVILLTALIGLFVWGFAEDPAAAPPLALAAVFIAIPSLLICGVLFALFQRIREIGKGEIDDAKKY